ncbi:MAG: LpqB family beta-propeller domain-containing protein [Candidatus Acidiferrales bacterium]
MTLAAGTKLGSYEITAAIGAGGMGEVYRARDAKLGRDVALKVLPEAFARDSERMARFQREAKVLASLNHPNIAAIYGFEDSGATHALVMELVEGPTLADRIKSGAIPIDEALRIAKQICEALEYAHERSIVHRDLKPANVKVTPDDAVKVLDFGLAKAIEGDASSMDMANSPTISRLATQAGVILGTAAYMSPEQAKGRPVDRRADIWAFGCVLFEMLTGKLAFSGETVTDTLAAVLTRDPDWSQLPAQTPARVRVLLQRCLQKDAKQRLQAIGDARISLDEVLSGAPEPTSAAAAPAPPVPFWRRALPWAVGALAGALAAGLIVGKLAAPAPNSDMHFSTVTNFAGVQAQPAISPDGRSVAFVSNSDGHFNIYVGLVRGGNLVQITHDPNLESAPSWSPDGTALAYARLNHWGIWDVWEVPALGGTPRRVILNAADPTWSPDGHSLAYLNIADGAVWISGVSGENAREVTHPLPGGFDLGTQPRFSPDGTRIAFSARTSSGGPYGELAVADLNSGRTSQLTHDNALALSPAWSADGRYIYFASSRGGTINIWKISATGGKPEQITAGEGDDADLDVSADGKRIVFGTLRQKIGIARLDLQVKPGQDSVKALTSDPARNQFGPAYSPDGAHLAFFSNLKGAEHEEIWVCDSDGANAAPLVQDARVNIFPAWSPDGRSILYDSESATFPYGHECRSVPVSGGAPQTLFKMPQNKVDVGRDGRVLFQGDKGQLEAFDPQDGKTQTVGTLPVAAGEYAHWSLDGHSVAYMVSPKKDDDPGAGLWVDNFKNPPRQVFRGWVIWFARGPGDELYLLQGKPDLTSVLWKVDWNGQNLTPTSSIVPILYSINYEHTATGVQFDASPDGRYLAFQTDQVLQENIGMIENVH